MAHTSLSTAACSVWAKTGENNSSLALHTHMEDSAAAAGRLWDYFLPSAVTRFLSADLNGDISAGRRRYQFLAAAHDVGKCTAAFTVQNQELAGRMRSQGFLFDVGQYDKRRDLLPHSLASQLLLEKWLIETRDWTLETARGYAVIAGSHHGVSPSRSALSDAALREDLLGAGSPWLEVQRELAEHALTIAATEGDLSSWAAHPLSAPQQVLLTAAVILADWLASDDKLFPYGEPAPSEERARRAWAELGLPPAWRAESPNENVAEFFQERFSLPAGSTVRPVQRAAVELAQAMPEPGLLIIEAAMGNGKTEAAFAVAEVLAHRFGAGGCFVALPTMATSDAMFSRTLDWLDRLQPQPSGEPWSVYLAHSKNSLNEEHRELIRNSRPSGIGDIQGGTTGEATFLSHDWLFGRKKGPLANFVVGTIDQFLFGSLKSRHLMLRHLALAGKVVILDEIHSADAYMNVYLDRMLGWLGAYKVPTILLSATLHSARRAALVEAYEHGADSYSTRANRDSSVTAPLSTAHGYPLITTAIGDGGRSTAIVDTTTPTAASIEPLADDDETLLRTLEELLQEGGCIAVIRNTVGRAQHTYLRLREHFGERVEVTIAHSRFVASDRAAIERRLRDSFGPPSTDRMRPHSAIVVGTQVLEQSLDVDFDLLVTDLAPIDLLLQRIGRMHRHQRDSRPPRLATPRCLVTGVDDWHTEPPTVGEGTSFIYGEFLLLRTLATLQRMLAGELIRLPPDIPHLVESSYGVAENIPESWADAVATAEKAWTAELAKKRQKAHAFLLGPIPDTGGSIIGWIDQGIGEVDDSVDGQAQVRDTEESLEVLVVCRVNGELRTLPHLEGTPDAHIPEDYEPQARVARAVANSSIRLPRTLSAPWRSGAVVGALEQNAFSGWQLSPLLRGQLVLVLDSTLSTELAGSFVHYSKEHGLTVTRPPKEES